jgi:hypothetical protein
VNFGAPFTEFEHDVSFYGRSRSGDDRRHLTTIVRYAVAAFARPVKEFLSLGQKVGCSVGKPPLTITSL